MLLLLLVGLPLPLRRHVVTNRASARGTQHAVMRHVSGDAADDGTLDTTLGLDWARRGARLGAGEILLNSMDADGTKAGFDLDMLRAVRAAVTVPVTEPLGATVTSATSDWQALPPSQGA